MVRCCANCAIRFSRIRICKRRFGAGARARSSPSNPEFRREPISMDPKHISGLRLLAGDPSRVILNPQIVEQLSRDFYWYSPVLRRQLDGKLGEVVVQPLGADEVQKILRYCFANDIPVTARGAGTGNYGQAVPLQGGVVLDL